MIVFLGDSITEWWDKELYKIYYDTLTNYELNFYILEGSLLNRQRLVKQVLINYGLVF